jgi:hypothetical protein
VSVIPVGAEKEVVTVDPLDAVIINLVVALPPGTMFRELGEADRLKSELWARAFGNIVGIDSDNSEASRTATTAFFNS